MNTRIQELAKVAEQLADDELAHLERVHNRLYSFTESREIYNQKFAELIVQKCIAVGEEKSKELFSYSKNTGDIFEYKSHAAQDVADSIKEQFGIK